MAQAHSVSASQEPLVLRALSQGVLTLTLNRPGQRNSLSVALMEALQMALNEAAVDPLVRVIVLAAAGPAFSSGHDLKELTAHRRDSDGGRAFFAGVMDQCARLMQTIVTVPKPVIARVQGIATAAGCQLVASADLALAAQNARFATPGVNIGLFCTTPMVALSRAVARKAALEMLLTGDMIDAEEARRIGLVNRVVPPESLESATTALALQLSGKSQLVLRLGKEAFERTRTLPLEEAYRMASAVMVENLLADDAEEGIGAFLDKRPPRWRDQ